MKKTFPIVSLLFIFSISLSQIAISQTTYASISLHEDLVILPINKNVFVHRSASIFPTYGKVQSNGLIYISGGEAMIMDTPVNDSMSLLLIKWLQEDLQKEIKGVIINHFHEDCLGSLPLFHQLDIPSYASKKTRRLAKKKGMPIPLYGFRNSKTLFINQQPIVSRYFGKGHTADNIVTYLPEEKVLFGGCMIKSLKSGKGNLDDASVSKWSKTVGKVKRTYINVETVVPGHGKFGDKTLLDYTIDMFKN